MGQLAPNTQAPSDTAVHVGPDLRAPLEGLQRKAWRASICGWGCPRSVSYLLSLAPEAVGPNPNPRPKFGLVRLARA